MDDVPEPITSRAGSLPLVGGLLALDLCNTSSGRDSSRPIEHLRTPDHVIAWIRHAGACEPGEAQAIAQRLRAEPSLGPELLRQTLSLREAVFSSGKALAERRDVQRDCLDELARIHTHAIGRAKLVGQSGAFAWRWNAAEWPIEAVLGPITLSALTLLTETEPRRIKQCHGHECGWLFFDGSKNNSRRWCEMEVCGNRAKQKRLQGRRSEQNRGNEGEG